MKVDIKKLILPLLIIILAVALIAPEAEPDKKEGWGGLSAGLMVIIAGAVMLIFPGFQWAGVITIIIGAALSGVSIPSLFIKTTIPGWAYIAGFVLLFFIISKKN